MGRASLQVQQIMKKKHTHHPITTILLSCAVIFLVAALLFQSSFNKYIIRLSDSIEHSVDSEVLRASTEKEMDELFLNLVNSSAKFYAEYAAYYMDEFGFSSDNLDTLGELYNSVNLYYFAEKKKDSDIRNIQRAKGSVGLGLTYEQIDELCRKSFLAAPWPDGRTKYFQSVRIKNGYVAVSYFTVPLEELGLDISNMNSSYSGETLLWMNIKDLEITSSSDISLKGLSATDVFEENKKNKNNKYIFGEVKGLGRCLIVYKIIGDEALVAAVPVTDVVIDGIRNALVPVALFTVIVIMILAYVLYIRKRRTKEELVENRIVLPFGLNIDRTITSNIFALVLFGMLLILAATLYSQALISYSDQNMQAESHLTSLESAVNINEKNHDVMLKTFTEDFYDYAQVIVRGQLKYPNTVDNAGISKIFDKITTMQSMSIYNKAGKVVASTYEEVGYSLNQSEGSSDSICWEVMNGTRDYAFIPYNADPDSGDYVVVARRQDAPGIIKIRISAPQLTEFLKKTSIEEAMLTTDFDLAETIVIDKEAPDTMKIQHAGATEVSDIPNVLPKEVLEIGYSGVKVFDRVSYFINNSIKDNMVFVSAMPVLKISMFNTILSIIILLLGMLVFTVILVCGMTFRVTQAELALIAKDNAENSNTINKLFKPETISQHFLDESFKKILKYMIMITGLLLVVIMIADISMSSHSVISYLIGNRWNRGVNLFSITLAIIICVLAFVTSYILRTFLRVVCRNLGPRGMTIGNLMDSLLKFAIFIITIIIILSEFGCNLSALLTGAGILGAAISICASATVNDLLSGFFIVFDGTFQIGDWVKVGDFRGQVLEIGMRTTKIAYADCIRVVNNSSLTNVTLMDRLNSGSLIKIQLAYKEDVDKVIELIDENRQRYREEIPKIADGPYVKGVMDFGSNGVEIELYAFTQQQYTASVERDVRRVTKRLFDENGIEIPFNQVTIHQAKED